VLHNGNDSGIFTTMQTNSRAERRFARHFNQALTSQKCGDDAKAQRAYAKALRIQENAAVYVNLGILAYSRGNLERAETLYRKAIKLDPLCQMAHNNLGVVLSEAGRFDESDAAYRESIRIKPTPEALCNVADKACREERYDEAMDLIMQALELNPSHPQSLGAASLVAWSQNRLDVAVAAVRRAIECGADNKARVNLGVLLLTLGQYEEGWKEYAWRFAANKIMMKGPESTPIWKGRQRVPGTLYVWPEQGLGDEILYAGAMKVVASRAEHVVWECEPRLVPLFSRGAPANVDVIPLRNIPPIATAQIPAGCLLQMFHPSEPRKAYLEADPVRREQIRAGLPEGKRIIGISWASSNKVFGHKKSLTLDDFGVFIENPDYHCISLQYGNHDHGPLHVIPDLDLTRDIDGVAAAIKCCDLVVTASNTVAHLAGALGVPCIVMVSSAGGKLWYWGTEDRTVWYDSLRIQRFERALS